MTEALYCRNKAKVESISSVVGESTNSTLAEDHLVVSLAHDVFGGHKEFFEGRGHSALQQNWLFSSSSTFKQRKVLHIAGTDMDDIGIALDQFERRTGFLEARGIDVKRVRFSTAFGRGFEYYTGLVFELTDPERTGDPLVAGGRYDDLLTRLGASDPIPAVGFAVWIERLAIYGGVS